MFRVDEEVCRDHASFSKVSFVTFAYCPAYWQQVTSHRVATQYTRTLTYKQILTLDDELLHMRTTEHNHNSGRWILWRWRRCWLLSPRDRPQSRGHLNPPPTVHTNEQSTIPESEASAEGRFSRPYFKCICKVSRCFAFHFFVGTFIELLLAGKPIWKCMKKAHNDAHLRYTLPWHTSKVRFVRLRRRTAPQSIDTSLHDVNDQTVYNLRSKRDWSFVIITNQRNQFALRTVFASTASSETENVLWENAVIVINQMSFEAKTSRIGAVASLSRGWACKRLLVSGAVVAECVTGFPRYAWVPKYNLGQKTCLLRWADYCKLCKCTVRGISTDCCWYIVFGTLLGIYACADRLICRVC